VWRVRFSIAYRRIGALNVTNSRKIYEWPKGHYDDEIYTSHRVTYPSVKLGTS